MKTLLQYGLVSLLIWMASANLSAQVSSDDTSKEGDSLYCILSSQIQELSSQLQDMNMQNIMLQEELQRTGRKVMMDSISQANRMHLIDSLRTITPGAPLVVDGDTLFYLYARNGGITPELRVKAAEEIIIGLGHRLTLQVDTFYVFEGDFSSDIMAAGDVILSITDIDGLWVGKTRSELAADYKDEIQTKVQELHDEYGLRSKLWGLLLAFVIVVAQVLLLKLTNRFFLRWKKPVMRYVMPRLNPLSLKDYEFLNVHIQGIIVMTVYKILYYLIILLQLLFSIPLLFSIFPETERMTFTVLGYIWNPF